MNFDEIKFQRVFSKSMYKSLKLPLAEMTFTKDFVNDKRGDLYPVIAKDDTCVECVDNNQYHTENGTVERMFTRFFPYATYEIGLAHTNGSCGFVFHLADQKARLICDGNELMFYDGFCGQKAELSNASSCDTIIVSCRPGAFDVYLKGNDKPDYLCTFKSEVFACSHEKKLFDKGFVSLLASGSVTVNNVCSYIDCGISQADMYQMYAYQKKYTSENVTLLYPLTEKVEQDKDIRFLSHDGTEIKIRFIDLFDLSNSLKAIVTEIKETE